MPDKTIRYEQLAQELRHYDNRLYVTPPGLLAILGISMKEIITWTDSVQKVLTLFFLTVVCHSFTVLFAKLSIHQMGVRKELEKLGAGHAKKPNRDTTYRRYSPLWLFYPLSADGHLMGMLMLSLLGTWAYTIKTALDASGISEISSFWLTALTVLITAPIYYYLILKSGRKDSMASNHANSADAKSRAAD